MVVRTMIMTPAMASESLVTVLAVVIVGLGSCCELLLLGLHLLITTQSGR